MYKCMECGKLFPEPFHSFERRPDADGFSEVLQSDHCPDCGSQYFHRAVVCPVCGDWMHEDLKCCEDCQEALRHKFSQFLNGLYFQEVEQLDEWLDGVSIRDFI